MLYYAEITFTTDWLTRDRRKGFAGRPYLNAKNSILWPFTGDFRHFKTSKA